MAAPQSNTSNNSLSHVVPLMQTDAGTQTDTDCKHAKHSPAAAAVWFTVQDL